MRRFLATVVASAAVLVGLGASTTTAAAVPSVPPTVSPAVAASADGWCDSWKKLSVGSYVLHQPMIKATGSRNCLLAEGASGSVVRILQLTLKQCNYASGLVVDGDFGPRTKKALAYAQYKRGVDDDGVYGPNTRKALLWPVYYPNGGTVGTCRPSPS
ncbi:peptidoglycan-binding domain-containing protein [Actinophytocola gossypii]|uniref:Peptidoglycan-binding protein n=1 Tax=Actinophytocola gossypii TaxID=2812003 RepID=A0ABT2J7S8_9PSEU|nr:peptidoglycan-binding domain-containing protein [Actinophytocola gossypii]MCT2583910.1 peptidoglycan-binding protein [Actinophytocola gossypii]